MAPPTLVETYTLRRIHPLSALRFGALVGGLIMLLPGLLIGGLVRSLVTLLRNWLESWASVSAGPLGEVSLLELAKLGGFLERLRVWDGRGWVVVLAGMIVTVICSGLLVGLLSALGARLYNGLAAIGGGIEVDLENVGGRPPTAPALHIPQTPPPARASGQPQLWLVDIHHPQQRWLLQPTTTTLGSAPGNDITLGNLAPHHAEIRVDRQQYILHDLSNGQSWVNGRELVGPNMLKDGFRLRLGPHELVVQSERTT